MSCRAIIGVDPTIWRNYWVFCEAQAELRCLRLSRELRRAIIREFINHSIYHCVITIITASITHGRDTARQHETHHYTEAALTYTLSVWGHSTTLQVLGGKISTETDLWCPNINVLGVTVAGQDGLCPARDNISQVTGKCAAPDPAR